MSTPAQAQPAGPCGLAQPAFCDTFTSAYQGGGRTDQLDPSRWSVSRITNVVNPTQLQDFLFAPATLPICDQNVGATEPDNDVRVCSPDPGESPYFDELFNDDQDMVYYDFRPRQPFDFANRTGSITFDSDAKTMSPHTWWIELEVTDQPTPATDIGHPGILATPRNGIMLDFSGCGSVGNDTIGGVTYTYLINNYATTQHTNNNTSCYTTADGQRNHFVVHLSQQHVDVWATNADGSNLRQVASLDNLNLPFSRGYVHFLHVQYNAGKEGASPQQHYEWANMGFDGPVLPTPRAYDVPDALGPGIVPRDQGTVNIGYQLNGGGIKSGTMNKCCPNNGWMPVPPFVLHNVDLTNAADALLNLNAAFYSPTSQLSYHFNNGPWRTIAYPFPDTVTNPRALSVPVSLADLQQGDNTLEFAAAQNGVQIANIDLTIDPIGVADSIPTDTPTLTPTASTTATSTPSSTPTSTQTPTPVPSATSTPTATTTTTPAGSTITQLVQLPAGASATFTCDQGSPQTCVLTITTP